MTQAPDNVVRKELVVQAPVDRAFSVFTERFGDFKRPEHNLLGAGSIADASAPSVSITRRGAVPRARRWC